MRLAEYVACVEEQKYVEVLVRKTERKVPLGRYRHNWEDCIEMGIK
jgi:hypothetical protein